jgi:iron complex outermembrane recepter protein
MNKLPMRRFGAVLGLATATLIAVSGFGQTADSTAAATKMDKFVVTGSYLPQAANTVAMPVITLDTQSLLDSGNNNDVLEMLRKTAPEFSGNGNLGSGNANVSSGSTGGGHQLSLRNASTLVLINGRRMAYSAISATGGYQFVDVNLVPTAAIERIEVVADGASAIYGTDAVSGVVNIIMKTNYEGGEAGGRYGWSTDKGHAAQRSAYMVGGASNGRTSVTFSAEWLKVDPIFNYERSYSDPTFGTPTFAGSVNIGGSYYYLDPAKNAPAVTAGGLPAATLVSNGTYSGPRTSGDQFQFFNLSQYVTQTVGNERQSASLAFDHKVNDIMSTFGDFLYSHTTTFSQINGQPINSSALAALTPGSYPGAGGSTIPAGLYGNPFNAAVTARNRLVDHPREYEYDTQAVRGVVATTIRTPSIRDDWVWELGGTYSRIDQNYQNPGVINNKNLAIATVNGDFNFFARQQKAGILEADGIVGVATGGFVSTLRDVDLKVRGSIFDLPAGPLAFAAGAEQRREGLSAVADPLSQLDPVTGQLGWNGATTLYPFDANRTVGALFAEIRVPVAKGTPGAHLVEVSGAIRHEFYSDTTNPTVPKVTFRYLPLNDDLAFRGTYSKSFSAPQLFSMFGPVSVGFTSPFTLNKAGGGTVANLQTNSMSGANPTLKPSTSKNFTLGVVYSPSELKGFSASIDYWNIKQKGLVGSIPSDVILNDVEKNGPNSSYASYVHFNSFGGPTAARAGQVSVTPPDDVYLINYSVNIAEQNLDGFDVGLKYMFGVSDTGRFNLATNIGVYNHYTHVDLPGDPKQETVGKSTTFNGTIPRWQAYTTLDYTRGAYRAFVGWRQLPGVTDDVDGTHVPSFNTFDLSAAYRFGPELKWLNKTTVSVGVNNVFNKFGPKDPSVFTDANVDVGTYGSWGRFIYVDLKYKF